MDNGIYDKKLKKEFINHSYFKPLVFNPVKEGFQSDPYFVFVGQNKKFIETLVNIVLFFLVILLLILLLLTSKNYKCLDKMNLKKLFVK